MKAKVVLDSFALNGTLYFLKRAYDRGHPTERAYWYSKPVSGGRQSYLGKRLPEPLQAQRLNKELQLDQVEAMILQREAELVALRAFKFGRGLDSSSQSILKRLQVDFG